MKNTIQTIPGCRRCDTGRATLASLLCFALFSLAHCKAETVVWQETFDDGNADSRWFADAGVWQIGSPSVGPQTNAAGFRTYSGTECATTGLDGNYLDHQDSRFIRIASFVVPPASQHPRLRFWHWFSFAGPYCPFNCDEGSYGYVELKAGGGNWQQISPTYGNSGSGVWSRPSIDLAPYAGQNVQIAFHFHSAQYTDVGWYVDDVALVKDAQVFNNPEGFELGLGDWYAERGTWEVGSPTSGPGLAFRGTNCAATVLAGNYASYVDSRFISPPFVVPAASSSPRLRFWQWYSFAGPYCPFNCDEGSRGYVEVKAGTNDWQQVSPDYTGSSSAVWTRPSIDLTAFAGQTVQVAFHLHSARYTDVGWYVDEVNVVTGLPVFDNPEGFELGLGDWYAERGTWEVGSPTSGPGVAYNGTNCAATVLAGNYASYVDSRFISPPVVVPAASSSPRLRFWQWYSFAGPYCPFNCDEGSRGYVEVKAGTNDWQQVSPDYTGSSSAVWTRPSMDLTAFAGQTVQVAFHLHSARYTDAGWYIDDVHVEAGAPVFKYPEGFELGLGDWYAERGTWEVGSPTSGPGSAHGGTNCAATVLGGNYASSVDSRLVSPPVLVPPSASNPALRFWHWYNFAGRYCPFNCDEGSYGYVEIRVGTNDWQTISPSYVGQSGSWTQPFFDLTPYGGQVIQVAFHFHSAHYVASGWYVDDVRLVYDFTLELASTIMRTQEVACLAITTFASSPATNLSFSISVPPGNLGSVSLQTAGRFSSATLNPTGASQWFVNLQTTADNPLMCNEVIGTLCFTAIDEQSAFAPFTLSDLTIRNINGTSPASLALGGRAVIIADQPLLEPFLGSSQQRFVTLYGKPATTYEIQYAIDVAGPSVWSPAWTNTVPVGLSTTSPVTGPASEASILYLRAKEQ